MSHGTHRRRDRAGARHDGRVANLTLDDGPYSVITWEMRQKMAERFAGIDADPSWRWW